MMQNTPSESLSRGRESDTTSQRLSALSVERALVNFWALLRLQTELPLDASEKFLRQGAENGY